MIKNKVVSELSLVLVAANIFFYKKSTGHSVLIGQCMNALLRASVFLGLPSLQRVEFLTQAFDLRKEKRVTSCSCTYFLNVEQRTVTRHTCRYCFRPRLS